jgi:hypothetical protein
MEYYRAGLYRKAVSNWETIPRESKYYGQAQDYIEMAMLNVNKTAGADKKYKKYLDVGIKLYMAGKYKKAVLIWSKIPEQSIYYKKSRKFMKKAEERSAPGEKEKQDTDYKRYLDAGIKLYRAGKYRKAILIWSRIPEDSEYYPRARKFMEAAREKAE